MRYNGQTKRKFSFEEAKNSLPEGAVITRAHRSERGWLLYYYVDVDEPDADNQPEEDDDEEIL